MQGFGNVKAVLSGDTVVLLGAAKGSAPPPEMQLSLSHLSAPRVSRHPEAKDEPFGWPAREFLRAHLIGKQVRFRVDYKSERSGRTFATLWLTEAPAESVNKLLAGRGLGRVVPAEQGKAGSDEYEELVSLSTAAAEDGLGIFNPTPGLGEATVRTIQWSVPPGDTMALAEELAKVPQPAIVEQVANGSVFRVLLTSTAPSLAITFNLAGVAAPKVVAPPAPAASGTGAGSVATPAPAPAPVRAPVISLIAASSSSGKPAWGKAAAATAAPLAEATTATAAPTRAVEALPASVTAGPPIDPVAAIAQEAKAFSEARLLHRDVLLHFGGVDKYGNFFGRVEHPAGDIAVDLLKSGLAKVADFSLQFAGGSTATLRAAERSAKVAKLRLWEHYSPTEIRGEKAYEGKVVEVVSGDTIVIAVPRPGGGVPEERRVSLSSVRAPRVGNPRRDEKEAPFASEAKEWLRRTLIGRDVTVAVEYTRAGAPGGAGEGGGESGAPPERTFATVTFATKKGDTVNVAVQLIGEGLAEVIRHRADEERSAHYDDLLAAEDAAKAAKKNVFSGKEPVVRKPTDLSVDATKAKSHFAFLQRARTMRGIVEYVFPGGRVKVFVPSENCTFMFGIGGIRCPAVARGASRGFDGKMRPGREAEPMGAEAYAYLRENLMQQEIELEADEVDKNGAILGPMWMGKGGARKNVATELLRTGLAYGIYPIIERVKDGAELVAAEAEAKAVKSGVWAFYTEPEVEGEGGDEGGALSPSQAAGAGAGVSSDGFPALGGSSSSAGGVGGGSSGVVCEITDGVTFYYHADADLAKLASITSKLDSMLADVGTQSAMVETKKGKVVACLFDDGGGRKWFRARIEGKAKAGEGATKSPDGFDLWEVSFIDFGNKDVVTVQSLRPLEASLAAIPALAKDAVLAFIRVPKLEAEYGTEAATLLSDLTFGRRLTFKAHGKDFTTGRALVSLWDPETGECVNEALIRAGVARVARKEAARVKRRGAGAGDKDFDLIARLDAAQTATRSARVGMFRYGDIGDSEDEKATPFKR